MVDTRHTYNLLQWNQGGKTNFILSGIYIIQCHVYINPRTQDYQVYYSGLARAKKKKIRSVYCSGNRTQYAAAIDRAEFEPRPLGGRGIMLARIHTITNTLCPVLVFIDNRLLSHVQIL